MASIKNECKKVKTEQMDTEEENQNQDQKEYSGFEGPGAKYVKLISSDKQEFILEKKYALVSTTLKNMLSVPGKNVVVMDQIKWHW